MYLLQVYVTNASMSVNQKYSYLSKEKVAVFTRVLVNFAHRDTTAIVINCEEFDENKAYDYKLKEINGVLDESPVLSDEQFELAKWLSYTTVSPFISCLNTMLPKPLRTISKVKKAVKIQRVRKLPIADQELTEKQTIIYDSINDGDEAVLHRRKSTSIFNKLLEKGLIEVYETEAAYKDTGLEYHESDKILNDQQLLAISHLYNTDKEVSLLYGVTGSGKTEVYLHLAEKYIRKGKEVLIMVPEISLTPMMIARVRERFNDVIFYHSELNDQERYEQYKRVKESKVPVVVGTRSAVFLPFKNLGLIIIDEEHDASYKQDSVPCYNARNVAIKRGKDSHTKVVLASATPSLEVYARALKGEYGFERLDKRVNNSRPQIDIIDMSKGTRSKESTIFHAEAIRRIRETVKKGQQVIVLLNRRGYSALVKCSNCLSVMMCKDCDCTLTYHKDENLLKCHCCSRVYSVPKTCPNCSGSTMIYQGYGTKRVMEELNNRFPDIRTLRMDRDSTSRKNAHEEILNRFEKHEADVLIGTQMIAKGLDFPLVTLVVILNGDSGLMHQDFNSTKTVFDLLMQASGRSGRSSDQGHVLIQSANQDHFVLKSVIMQNHEYFYKIEMNYRQHSYYPPYSRLLEIILSDENDERVKKSADILYEMLVNTGIFTYKPIKINKISRLERYRLLIKGDSIARLLKAAHEACENYLKERNVSGIKVNPDPLYLE